MVIFHCYVSSPEGKTCLNHLNMMFVDYPKYEATEGSPPDVPLYSMQSGIGIYDHIITYIYIQ